MSVEATVTPRPDLIPDGTAVVAVESYKGDRERRRRRAPFPTPTATGVMASGSVTLTGLTADTGYILFPVTDEVQSVKVKAKKGKFKLKVTARGTTKETAGVAFNATAAAVREAIEALSNVEASEVEVTGGPGDETGSAPYVVKFLKGLAGTDVAAMEAVTTELEETPKEVTISTTAGGTSAPPEGDSAVLFRSPKE